jgi:hypothetical protein
LIFFVLGPQYSTLSRPRQYLVIDIPRIQRLQKETTGGLDIVIVAAARVLAEGFLTVLGDCAIEYRNPKRINDDEIAAELVHFGTPRFVIASEIVANHGNRVELLRPGAR